MEFSQKQLRDWIEQRFAPVILVRTTDDVEVSAVKNGLNFIDFLRPYEKIKKEIYTRTVKEFESYPLQNFYVRFRTLEELEHQITSPQSTTNPSNGLLKPKYYDFLSHIVRESYLDDPVKQNYLTIPSPQIAKDSTQSLNTLNQLKEKNFTPWFDLFREEWLLSIRTSEHECFEHPVACLSVTSTANSDPVKSLKELFNPDKPPQPFIDKAIDPDLYRFFILVHDIQNGPNDSRVKNIFRKVTEVFGATCCRLLIINSNDPTQSMDSESSAMSSNNNKPASDIWSQVLPRYDIFIKKHISHSKNLQFGKYMTHQDVEFFGAAVDELITNGVVPHLERKIRQINTSIANKKKGIGNIFMRTFGFGSGSKKNDASDRYTSTSSEIQLRKMADYAFMLHDYDTAKETYKIVASDFKNNKDNLYYSGTQEMIAITTILTNGQKKEVETGLETAYYNYRMNKNEKFALRTALIQAMYYKTNGEFKKAADMFIRATSVEENNFFQAALLFEQAAFCYLLIQQFRKFAFFMIFSGYRFSHSNQMKHAYRCYKSSLSVYYSYGPKSTVCIEEKWNLICEHLSITMGRLSNHMKDLKSSIVYLHDFMCSCAQLPENQRSYMSEFLATVREYINNNGETIKNDFDLLDIPRFEVNSLQVLINQYGTISSTDKIPIGKWRELEESLVKSIRGKMEILKWESNYNRNRIENAVVGEQIKAEFWVSNPLQIPLQINELTLLALFESIEDEQNRSKQDNKDTESTLQVAGTQSCEYFEVDPIDIELKPSERRSIELTIRPLKPGKITITGIQWVLFNTIKGRKQFKLKGRRLNENRQQRCGEFYEEYKQNQLHIVEKMPLLKMEALEFSNICISGITQKAVLRLTNVGSLGMKNIQIKTSHPQIVTIGSSSDKEQLFPGNFELEDDYNGGSITTATLSERYNTDLSFFKIEADQLPLKPQQSIDLPIYVRGGSIGEHKIHFLCYYEPEIPEDASITMTTSMKKFQYRLHQFILKMAVKESLKVTYFSQPSSVCNDEFVLGISIKNEIPILSSSTNPRTKILKLRQLTSISPSWTLRALNFTEKSNEDIFGVYPGESTTLYFKILKSKLAESITNEMIEENKKRKVNNNLPLLHSHFVFPSSNAMHKTLNTGKYPIIDLLIRESAYSPDSLQSIQNLHEEQAVELINLQKQYPANSFSSILEMMTINNPALEGRVFPFLDLFGLSIMLFWEIEDKVQFFNISDNESSKKTVLHDNILGQSHILKVKFLPELKDPYTIKHAASSITKENTQCPLRFSLSYPEVFKSNFQTMCSIPVDFEIQNFSPNLGCDFTLELLTHTRQSKSSAHGPSYTPTPFIWAGTTRIQFKDVKPGEVIHVPVQVCVFTPGIYNLNLYRVTWKTENNPTAFIRTFHSQQNLIKVVSTDDKIDKSDLNNKEKQIIQKQQELSEDDTKQQQQIQNDEIKQAEEKENDLQLRVNEGVGTKTTKVNMQVSVTDDVILEKDLKKNEEISEGERQEVEEILNLDEGSDEQGELVSEDLVMTSPNEEHQQSSLMEQSVYEDQPLGNDNNNDNDDNVYDDYDDNDDNVNNDNMVINKGNKNNAESNTEVSDNKENNDGNGDNDDDDDDDYNKIGGDGYDEIDSSVIIDEENG